MTLVGALGAGVAGVTALDVTDDVPLPNRLVATTLNVYEVPFVSDGITHEVILVVHVPPAGVEVTV
jgi:hypothetical protein